MNDTPSSAEGATAPNAATPSTTPSAPTLDARPSAAPAAAPASAPAAAPAADAPAAAPAAADPVDAWFNKLATFEDDGAEGADPFSPAVVATEPKTAPDAAPPAAQPQVEPPKQPTTEPAAAQPPSQTQQEPPPTSGKESGPDRFANELAENEEAMVSALEARYAMTPEMLEAFENEPGPALAKMAAQVHFDIAKGMLKAIGAIVPQIVTEMQQSQSAGKANMDEFFRLHPNLKPEHQNEILQAARVYRATYPDAPKAQMMKDVGMMVAVKLGLAAAPATNGAHPPAPKVPPFTPATTSQVVSTQPVAEAPWAGLARDYDE